MDPDTDVLVEWERDGSKNVVRLKDLSSSDRFVQVGSVLQVGSVVTMQWKRGSTWRGRVLDMSEMPDSEEDDIPLAYLRTLIGGMFTLYLRCKRT